MGAYVCVDGTLYSVSENRINMIIPSFVGHIDWIDSGYNRIFAFILMGHCWQAYHDDSNIEIYVVIKSFLVSHSMLSIHRPISIRVSRLKAHKKLIFIDTSNFACSANFHDCHSMCQMRYDWIHSIYVWNVCGCVDFDSDTSFFFLIWFDFSSIAARFGWHIHLTIPYFFVMPIYSIVVTTAFTPTIAEIPLQIIII